MEEEVAARLKHLAMKVKINLFPKIIWPSIKIFYLGEGDCEGHSDCKRGLVCGNNNCKKFGTYYHEKDDCCEKPSSPLVSETPSEFPHIPDEPPFGTDIFIS